MNLKQEKMKEIKAFAENQFASKDFKVDFSVLHPKVYLHPDKYVDFHHVYYDNLTITGLYLLYPLQYAKLNLCGVGTVCVNKDYRNQGIMKRMFQDITQLEKNYDLMYLSGDRKRYENYGYYPAGKKYVFYIKRRCLATFEGTLEIQEYQNESQNINKLLYEMYKKQKCYATRDETWYLDVLKTSSYRTFLILQNGIVGYLVYDEEEATIVELVSNDRYLENILVSLMNKLGRNDVSIELGISDDKRYKCLRVADSYEQQQIMHVKIINYPNVLTSLLKLKKNLLKGSIILGGFASSNLKISIGENIEIIETKESADLILDAFEINNLMFSDLLNFSDYLEHSQILRSWFPLELPITLSTIDSI